VFLRFFYPPPLPSLRYGEKEGRKVNGSDIVLYGYAIAIPYKFVGV